MIIAKAIIVIVTVVTLTMMTIINNWWILPEMQRDRCLYAVHSWYIDEAIRVRQLQVPDEIKAELMIFAEEKEIKQAKAICGVNLGNYQAMSNLP